MVIYRLMRVGNGKFGVVLLVVSVVFLLSFGSIWTHVPGICWEEHVPSFDIHQRDLSQVVTVIPYSNESAFLTQCTLLLSSETLVQPNSLELNAMSSLFWLESFWLPANVSWSDFESRGVHYPCLSDLLWDTLKWTIIMGTFRAILIRYCIQPLGLVLGVSPDPPSKVPHRDDLEEEYVKAGRKIAKLLKNTKYLASVGEQTGLSVEEVKNWLRRRWGQDDLPDIEKFNQETWLAVFYVMINAYGFYYIAGESWVWNMDEFWTDWPFQSVNSTVSFYYTQLMTFLVLDSTVLFFKQHDRKSHFSICIHHLLASILVLLSWANNTTRLGATTIFILELSSPIVYVGRAIRRAGNHDVADTSVFLLTLVWIANRVIAPLLYIFPAISRRHLFIESSPALTLMSFFAIVIFFLITFWTAGVFMKITRIIAAKKKMEGGRWKKYSHYMTSLPDLRKDKKQH